MQSNCAQWLIVNNMHYNKVMITNDTLGILPTDSHLTKLVSVILPSSEVEFSAEHDDNPYSTYLQSACAFTLIFKSAVLFNIMYTHITV